ncbi:MAG: hypothetical protein PHX30_02255 [Candidatus Pacebacteria bacterium]|nr:hypothetical protein [Candidatus Paceibacterota bacterium]
MGIFYDNLIEKHKKRVSFVVLVTFLFTFVFVRLYVLSATFGILEDPYIYIKGYHVHHLNYGIVIMAIAGFLALVFQNEKNRLKIGVLYGLGLGLTFDEFGMWFKLDDDYWVRASYDAVVLISLFFISLVYFPSFWYYIWNNFEKDTKKFLKIR